MRFDSDVSATIYGQRCTCDHLAFFACLNYHLTIAVNPELGSDKSPLSDTHCIKTYSRA